MIIALSLVLAIYAFVIALLLFVAQTETYNRVYCYRKLKKKNSIAWVVIYNTSRRYLVSDDIFRPLSIDSEGLTNPEYYIFGPNDDIEKPELYIEKDCFKVHFGYMEPKSAIVVKADANNISSLPKVKGVIKGGRLINSGFGLDDIAHCIPLVILGYSVFCALVISIVYFFLYKNEIITNSELWVYIIGTIVFALGICLFFRNHRRVLSREYNKVKHFIRTQSK